jgi:hypothetical protein
MAAGPLARLHMAMSLAAPASGPGPATATTARSSAISASRMPQFGQGGSEATTYGADMRTPVNQGPWMAVVHPALGCPCRLQRARGSVPRYSLPSGLRHPADSDLRPRAGQSGGGSDASLNCRGRLITLRACRLTP